MDRSQPWSVKGIDPETRQAAKMAARRAGLTVGAWLNQAIRRAAAEELGAPRLAQGQEPLQATGYDPLGVEPRSQVRPTEGQPSPAQLAGPAVETLLDAMRRQTEEVKAAIRDSTDELRFNTDKIQPLTEKMRPMSDRIEAIAGRLEQVGEVDRRLNEAERKAERASLQVTPLERTLTRLFERLDGDDRLPAPDYDGRYRRRGLLGKLFGE